MAQRTTTRLFLIFDELLGHSFYWSAATLWHEILLRLWGQRLALGDLSHVERKGLNPDGLDMATASNGRLAGTLSQMWQTAKDSRDRGSAELYEEILTIAGTELLKVRALQDRASYCLLIELLMEVWQDRDGRLIDEALTRAEL